MLDNLRWISDYFVKCHNGYEVFTGQVGDTNTDHSLWERAEDMKEYRPSADLTPSAPGTFLPPFCYSVTGKLPWPCKGWNATCIPPVLCLLIKDA